MTTPARNAFDEAYQSGTPPWVIGEPQAAVVALEKSGAIRGTVLDVGCGLGEHTILLSSLGYDVLGVDFAPNAVAQARANAVAKGVDARFEVRDALSLGLEADQAARYDTVLDSALFHVFGDDTDRARYVASLHAVIRPGGVLHLLALSDEGRGFGPSVGEDTIRTAFIAGWNLETLEVTTYRGVVGAAQSKSLDLPVGTVVEEPAWLARVRRR
ncbi:class I SAM-dependent methyltransferase [Mycobacterium sp. NPDC006124]|uniref:class I SAM-dependent methyltransferase n=1 Tax=Mycobacterium sp. NPDC006124 TaxID=3156729 RepID=UPI0033ACA872